MQEDTSDGRRKLATAAVCRLPRPAPRQRGRNPVERQGLRFRAGMELAGIDSKFGLLAKRMRPSIQNNIVTLQALRRHWTGRDATNPGVHPKLRPEFIFSARRTRKSVYGRSVRSFFGFTLGTNLCARRNFRSQSCRRPAAPLMN